MSRPLRLLITADAVGGIWQYATDLARGLLPLGIEPIIASLGPSPSAAQRRSVDTKVALIDTGQPLDWLAGRPAEVLRAGEAIAALAEQLEVDLVQLNTPALAAGEAFGVPTVAVAHSCVATWWAAVKDGALPADLAWRAGLHARGLVAGDRVVAPSAAFAESTRRAYGLPIAPTVVHNGRRALAAASSAQHDCALTVARLWDPGKNAGVLDAAAESLPFPFYAAGPCTGPNGDAIELRHAHALGAIDERQLGLRLAAGPVFASAALYEPFGLAVLEAAAAGCPLVLSDIPTFRELWSGVAAFIAPDDAAGFAEAIGLIVEDNFARAEMGRRSRARAALYSVEAMAARMAAIYRDMAAVPAAASRPAMVAA